MSAAIQAPMAARQQTHKQTQLAAAKQTTQRTMFENETGTCVTGA